MSLAREPDFTGDVLQPWEEAAAQAADEAPKRSPASHSVMQKATLPFDSPVSTTTSFSRGTSSTRVRSSMRGPAVPEAGCLSMMLLPARRRSGRHAAAPSVGRLLHCTVRRCRAAFEFPFPPAPSVSPRVPPPYLLRRAEAPPRVESARSAAMPVRLPGSPRPAGGSATETRVSAADPSKDAAGGAVGRRTRGERDAHDESW